MASQPFLGGIFMFGGNFAPQGYAFCNGQLLSISQNTALFSLLGTTYGGDGVTTFALPNLQGRVPIHSGNGAGLSPYVLGQNGGTENVTLTQGQMPAHNHVIQAGGAETTSFPAGAVPAQNGAYTTGATPVQMASGALTNAGGSQPHNNIQPYLTITFIIALQGVYPSRS
ncbi:MAG: tail fiber protein [Solirubrobacteraceae bacterium]